MWKLNNMFVIKQFTEEIKEYTTRDKRKQKHRLPWRSNG